MSDQLSFDVVIVGAGPSGLSAAIRLGQLCRDTGRDLSICVLEKGSEVGAHILSGAVFEPRALDELIPDWRTKNAPIHTAATSDSFVFLTQEKHITLPTPPLMHNNGNYIISLGALCRWLAIQAESLGIQIYPGFAVAKCLFDENDRVIGVETTPMGVGSDGIPTPQFEPGVQILARHVMLGEGCRGSLSEEIMEKYGLRRGVGPQTYGIGLKELWQIAPEKHNPGHICHTIGWPLDSKTYGGSFLYHFEDQLVSFGLVLGLDYKNPYLSPFDEMQRLKHHPFFKSIFEGGKRLTYGARALNEGGFQSIPHLAFPGGNLMGCAAGFMNVPKIKGSHTAMKTGMIAADVAFEALSKDQLPRPGLLNQRIRESWVGTELHDVRNIRPGFRWGLIPGMINAAFETYVMGGKSPWTFDHHTDHQTLIPASESVPIDYPKPDGVISFDKIGSVYYSNTNHRDDQPCHLRLKNPDLAISYNHRVYDSPETRYCPAGVYEIIQEKGDDQKMHPKLLIHGQNCVHCKTCDIKDPKQNIHWTPPEGGGGPNYPNM